MDHSIVGGDFNTILDREVDCSDGRDHKNQKASAYLNNIIEEMELIDVWHNLYPDRFGFTWHRSKPKALHERLDFFLVSDTLLQTVEKLDIYPGLRSDHALVTMDLIMYKVNRGPGFWKLNNSLLENKDYVEAIKRTLEIQFEEKQNYAKKKDHWKIIKLVIRQTSMQFGVSKQRR